MILGEDRSGCRLGFHVGFVLGYASVDSRGFRIAVPEQLLERKRIDASAVHQGSERMLGAAGSTASKLNASAACSVVEDIADRESSHARAKS